jgi:hypothetical protein
MENIIKFDSTGRNTGGTLTVEKYTHENEEKISYIVVIDNYEEVTDIWFSSEEFRNWVSKLNKFLE